MINSKSIQAEETLRDEQIHAPSCTAGMVLTLIIYGRATQCR
jgi:hypothetical protein